MRKVLLIISMLLPGMAFAGQLQRMIDAAQPGSTLTVPPGDYEGPITIEKPLNVAGNGNATITGNGQGSTVWIHADGVTISGFRVRGSGLDLQKDNAGIFVQGNGAVVRNNVIEDSLHGIYVKKCTDCQLIGNRILGKQGRSSTAEKLEFKPDGAENCDTTLSQNQRGNGIHLWNSERITVKENQITDTRDGIYFSFTHHCQVTGNIVRHVRFGLHYMYSDYNYFDSNGFTENSAGAAVMYSKGLLIKRNTFAANVGQRAYGLVMMSVDSSRLEENEFTGNSIGVFVELSNNNVFVDNTIARGYVGARMTGSSDGNQFTRNRFVKNLHQVEIDGSLGENQWTVDGVGNDWDTAEVDLNGDGIGEMPHREADLLGALRRPFPMVAFLSGSPALGMIRFAQQHTAIPKVPAITDAAPIASRNTSQRSTR
jgi:nitrous oxidase accessory protein